MWKVEGKQAEVERLERIIRVFEKSLQESKRFSLRQIREDKERLSQFRIKLNSLKKTIDEGTGGTKYR